MKLIKQLTVYAKSVSKVDNIKNKTEEDKSIQ